MQFSGVHDVPLPATHDEKIVQRAGDQFALLMLCLPTCKSPEGCAPPANSALAQHCYSDSFGAYTTINSRVQAASNNCCFVLVHLRRRRLSYFDVCFGFQDAMNRKIPSVPLDVLQTSSRVAHCPQSSIMEAAARRIFAQ